MKSLVLCAALVSLSAFAGQAQQAQQQRVDKLPTSSWETLKAICANPAQFQRQNKPAEIKVTCTDTQLVWRAIEAGPFNLPRARVVLASAASDKLDVSEVRLDLPLPEARHTCSKYRQYREDVSFTLPLTCEQVLAAPDLATFCKGKVDEARADQSVIRETATNNIADTCPASPRQQDARQQSSTVQQKR